MAYLLKLVLQDSTMIYTISVKYGLFGSKGFKLIEEF